MNTCGTCKHFGPLIAGTLDDYDAPDADVANTKFHKCELLQHLNVCYMPKSALSALPAGVIDSSGYHATMCVSDEFGCNQHSALVAA